MSTFIPFNTLNNEYRYSQPLISGIIKSISSERTRCGSNFEKYQIFEIMFNDGSIIKINDRSDQKYDRINLEYLLNKNIELFIKTFEPAHNCQLVIVHNNNIIYSFGIMDNIDEINIQLNN